MTDDTKYRVNLVCSCANDIAYGYGPTVEQARDVAQTAFKRDHGNRARVTEEIVEVAVVHDDQGSSHYEEVRQ